jgi:hypothetical protein
MGPSRTELNTPPSRPYKSATRSPFPRRSRHIPIQSRPSPRFLTGGGRQRLRVRAEEPNPPLARPRDDGEGEGGGGGTTRPRIAPAREEGNAASSDPQTPLNPVACVRASDSVGVSWSDRRFSGRRGSASGGRSAGRGGIWGVLRWGGGIWLRPDWSIGLGDFEAAVVSVGGGFKLAGWVWIRAVRAVDSAPGLGGGASDRVILAEKQPPYPSKLNAPECAAGSLPQLVWFCTRDCWLPISCELWSTFVWLIALNLYPLSRSCIWL